MLLCAVTLCHNIISWLYLISKSKPPTTTATTTTTTKISARLRDAFKWVVSRYEVPAEIETDKQRFGPLSGQSLEARVVDAYRWGLLLRKGEEEKKMRQEEEFEEEEEDYPLPFPGL